MKAILISIKPKYVTDILNGKKTIEIRKKFPKDYVGWVYIYCTKGNKNKCLIADLQPDKVYHPLTEKLHRGVYSIVEERAIWNDCKKYILNGKVVARFWCDKVEEIKYHFGYYNMGDWTESYILENTCLTSEELDNYLKASQTYDEKKIGPVCGYAIHITKLEIFDKPKEISEFKYYKKFSEIDYMLPIPRKETCERLVALTRVPESFCYIEID